MNPINASGSPAISTCRVIILLDRDAFYASVEQRDNPALQGQPVIVGSPPPRSIVTTASREARKFGIHSGMGMRKAKALCPHGHFIAPRMSHYKAISNSIKRMVEIVAGPQAILQTVALDEIYVDLTAYCSAATDDDALRLAFPYAANMKVEIMKGVNLTCTVGIASNKMLAKLASDQNKPNGVGIILESKKVAALSNLPVKVLDDVGKKRTQQLNAVGIHTVQDIRNYTGNLCAVVGKSLGSKLPSLAMGIELSPVEPNGPPETISKELTFTPENESNPTVLDSILLAQAHFVAAQLKLTGGRVAFTVFIVACYKHPAKFSRQMSFDVAVSTGKEILDAALALVKKHNIYKRSLYLLGLGVANLHSPGAAVARKPSRKSGKGDADEMTLFDLKKT